MNKEYVAYVRDPKNIPKDKEILLVIRDLTPGTRKYDARVVKAVVLDTPDSLPDSDILHLRSGTGILHPHPKAIKIIEELGTSLPGKPYSDVLARQE